jgi:hypothetical protein
MSWLADALVGAAVGLLFATVLICLAHALL